MIERVATAIETGVSDLDLRKSDLDWNAVARAAIKAMREPTEAMIQAADWPMHGEAPPPDITWRAMIDEALK